MIKLISKLMFSFSSKSNNRSIELPIEEDLSKSIIVDMPEEIDDEFDDDEFDDDDIEAEYVEQFDPDSGKWKSVKLPNRPKKNTKERKPINHDLLNKKLDYRDPFLNSFIAIDFETANKDLYSACQLGIVVIKDAQIVDQLKYNIQPPGNEYGTWQRSKHGMSAKDTAHSPTFKELWPQLKEIINSNPIVCHNWSTDINVLDRLREFYALDDMIINEFHCTYDLTGLNLPEAAQGLGVPLLSHHDGLADAMMCAQIYLKLKEGKKINHDLILVPKSGKIGRDENIYNKAINHPTDFFNGKIVVVTGVFGMFEKEDIKEIIKLKGGLIRTSISGKTQIIIQGLDAGPAKMAKALELIEGGKQIEIITESDFNKLVGVSE